MTIIMAISLAAWTGFLFGVSFFAIPIKFRAKSLTLEVAAEIGKVTFEGFNNVEWGILFIVAGLGYYSNAPIILWIGIGIVFIIKALQSFYIQPGLDVHTRQLMQGIKDGDSKRAKQLHVAYIAVEVLKLVVLIGTTITLCL